MSKAFVKEEENEDDDLELTSNDPVFSGQVKNYITPQGAKKLQDELKQLLYTARPDLVKTIAWAASNGDRSENGDYIYGKRKLREIDRRIRFLTKRLEKAEIIDPQTQQSTRVLFGATVLVQDENLKKETYTIVGIDESNPSIKHISWISPIAKALLNAQVGDTVSYRTPKGDVEVEILAIRYQAIAS